MADEGGGHKSAAGDLIKNGISPEKLRLSGDSFRLSSQLDLDPYDEDQAELRFLRSKPTCFVVLGKPGVGKTAFASQLAEEWKCQLVNANQVITEAIRSQTELGRRTDDILLRGESVPEELAVKLIEEKINSPEVAHHGYVLDDFPCLSEEFLTIKQQLEFINNWPLTPDFIIHLKVPDKDLENRRIGQRIDPVTGDLYTKDVYDPEKPKKEVKAKAGDDDEEEEEEEEEVAEEDEDEESNKLAPEIIERLIKRPEDLPSHVGNNIQMYKSGMLRLLEDFMADHNQLCLIELDANKPTDVLVKDILVRLSCFQVTPAAVPIRLNEVEAEEDSVPDDTDTDDLFRSLAGKRAPSARFRWRRSRWQRCCPVALTEGNLLPGRAELAVAFLDKIYFLSSEEALSAFVKNPRPYLLPPQPRPPCKLIVTGPPLSGKSTLCDVLASRYGAQVLNIKEKMGPKLLVERERKRVQLTEEATQAAIIAVRAKLEEEAKRKLKEEQEAQQRKVEEEQAKRKIEEAGEEEEEEEEEMEDDEKTLPPPTEGDVSKSEEKDGGDDVEEEVMISSPVEGKPEVESEEGLETNTAKEEEKVEENTNETDGPEADNEEPVPVTDPEIRIIEVTADHPDVVRAVEEALNAAKLDELQLPLDGWMDTLEQEIEQLEKELRENNPNGPLHGGWILDNFPETKEQWTMLFERNVILPDCILSLQDNSPNGELLIKRWYMTEKDSIDAQINGRLEKERLELQKQEEEKQRLIDEQKEAEAQVKAEAERVRRLESGQLEEGAEEEEEKETPHEQKEESQKQAEEEEMESVDPESAVLPKVIVSRTEEGQADEAEKQDEVNLDESAVEGRVGSTIEGTPEDSPPKDSPPEFPLEGPEVAAYRDLIKKYDASWTNIVSIITGNSALEPFGIEIAAAGGGGAKADAAEEEGEASDSGPLVERRENEISDEIAKYMEKIFVLQGWERSANDIDEEEGGDMTGEEEEEEEEQEEEEESEDFDPSRSGKKPLGDTSFYCPVSLKEKGVLWPGDPECAAKYREKIYYLSDADARDRFLADPALYLPKDEPLVPPPLRILLLGPRGAGKTTHGRHLAKKLGLFHIQFRERLQELVIAKTKKRVVPEREEEPEDPVLTDEEPDEVSPAISMVDESKGATIVEEVVAATVEGQSIHSVTSPTPNATTPNPVTPSVAAMSDAAEQEVSDEVPVTQLTDEEESIVSYLRDDEPLPADILLKLLEDWFHQEPFKSTGFILDDFPSTADEVSVLGEHGLYPDAAVILNIEDTDVLARLLPPKMDRWRQRRDRKHTHRQQVKDKKKEKRDREMKLRKQELLKEADARRQERLAERQREDGDATDEDEEEPEEDDIDAKIAEEFEEEEEEEEEEETEEDASDRMKNEFMDIYENDMSKIAAVTDRLMELMIPRIEIESGRRQTIVRYTLTKKLKSLVEHRMSMFERVYPISERLAQKMIQIGYKQKSRFGQWCPVKLSEGDYQQPRHDLGFNSFPAIHRAFIYFLSSQQAREEFMRDPLTFLCQPSPKPVVPIRIAIIGPPKSGKTILAKRFAEEFGLVRLSIGEAIRNVLANQPRTELAQCIRLYLYQGLTVPDECAVQALEVYMMDAQCQTRGYILDGYPLKKIQVDLMEERNIIPVKVIEIQAENKELANRATKDRYSPERVLPLHDSAQIFAVKLSAWQAEIEAVRNWFQEQHLNWVALPGERSKWWMWNSAKDIAKNCVVQIQTYLQRIAEGKAASIADMCITPSEFAGRLADFGQYCPVSLALKGELCDCSSDPTLTYAAEYRGHYYKLAGPEELDIFLRDPEKFVPPNAPRRLPSADLLPKRRTGAEARQMFPKAIELQGYCPVTFYDGKQRYEAIVPGDPELVVEYHDKLFCMETEEKLQKFMRLPEKYWNLKLPHKLPARKQPMRVNGLPMLGYLEQTVAQVVTKAMTAVGNFKPKYPFMSATQSALVYFALQLKAMNPNNTEYVRKKYKRKLSQYEETCELISYLGINMTRRYKEPKERPIDFDFKLEKFMQLQATKVQPNMWVS